MFGVATILPRPYYNRKCMVMVGYEGVHECGRQYSTKEELINGIKLACHVH